MRYRRLGRDGPLVSAIGLGCYGMTGGYGPVDQSEAVETIATALDRGVNVFDTSDTYGAGRNEELLGRALKGRREEAFIVTKFGNPGRDEQGNSMGLCGAPAYVSTACERSLRRLGVEAVDLYLLHRVDPKYPIEDTVGAMGALVRAGKVRHIGICEAAPATIARAYASHPLAAVQSEYSLWSRDVENGGHLAECRTLGVAFMAYSPLGRGFFADAVEKPLFTDGDPRTVMPRFSQENLIHNRAMLAGFKAIAAELSATPGQLALAWLLARGDDIVPIPGTRRRRHLEDNLRAVDITLSPEDVARIDAVVHPGVVVGTRYDEDYLKTLDL